jgi:hypothetical protein
MLFEMSKYLQLTDTNVKMQMYYNPEATKIFDPYIIDFEVIKHVAGNGGIGPHWNPHPRLTELFWIILNKMGKLWNPRDRPLMLLGIQHGILTFDLLNIIFINPSHASNIINAHIEAKQNIPILAAARARQARKPIEDKLRSDIDKLNNVKSQKLQLKNTSAQNLINKKKLYQNALDAYNKIPK